MMLFLKTGHNYQRHISHHVISRMPPLINSIDHKTCEKSILFPYHQIMRQGDSLNLASFAFNTIVISH